MGGCAVSPSIECRSLIFAALSPKLIRESIMYRRTTYLVLFTVSLTSGMAGLPEMTSAAEEPIGVTAAVRNTVSQLEPQVTRIAKGDQVVRNEVVRTAADSDARFVFRDDTNLSLGPGSTLKLDRTVFDDPKAGDIAIKLTQGAFRFVTGHSNKEAYVITTPIATMGVRGTTLDVLVERRQNKVVLVAGGASVCVPGKCVDLIHEGDSVTLTGSGNNVNIDVQNGSDWTFDNVCGSSCGTSTFAEAGGNDINTASLGTGAGAGGGGGGGPTAPGSFPTGGGGGGGGGGTAGQGTGSGGGGGGGTGGGGVGGGGGGTSGGGTLTGGNSSTGVTTSTSP
jgi:FecR protein